MKKVKYLFNSWSLLFMIACLTACKHEINDIEKVQETLELKVSSENITLDENDPGKDILTFNWDKARNQSDDHMVTYITKLDVLGNNFGSSTAIMTYEDDGVFTKSFTSAQLLNWANQKWKVATNKPFTLEFRVVAQWEGGATFEAPEVRTVRINVLPKKVSVGGTAVPGNNRVEMQKTIEDLNQYAFVLNLQPGELQIPVETNGKTNYITATDGSSTLKDGTTVGTNLSETPFGWKIETAGEYRVVVNLLKATATIYSPAKALQPKIVQWGNAATPISTTVNELWMHGQINSFLVPIKMDCQVSVADPQILVYTGGRVGKTKFIVYGGNDNNKNLAYAFSCPLTSTGTSQELALSVGTVAPLAGGNSSAQRNSYYTIPSGTNIIIFDLRNMTILADRR
ncbi:SusE domain-containing protein [Mucilaginibacter aquatilis]|uniref:SusE outer membrane protein domain-containing protein n=1 Tax=Mucilaginibacter aquatilis TaxID=1517760 RepID=A0A6I4IEE7_9SPHI|nr:SusE domain-containing protein [Mucilaginibacter aquatilis]MVN91739.1 hypothetical protein [Mucilaginibacter aquatilis]